MKTGVLEKVSAELQDCWEKSKYCNMTTLTHTLLVKLIGLASVTLIDSIGSIASRRLQFNYGWLTILSLSVYTCTGYFIGEESNLNLVFAANCIIGFYDATIGCGRTEFHLPVFIILCAQ